MTDFLGFQGVMVPRGGVTTDAILPRKLSNLSETDENAREQKVPVSNLFARATLGLTPLQITAVIALFFVTSIGAVGLAWAFRKWNGL